MSDLIVDHNVGSVESEESIKSRKQAAAELRKARKNLRDPRSRLFSDSSDELPKSILKNACIPKKRSASECVDDLAQIIAGLNLNIRDLPRDVRYCPLHHSYFNEQDEEEADDEHASDAEDDDDYEEEEGEDDDEADHSLRPAYRAQGGDSKLSSKSEKLSEKKEFSTGLLVDNQQQVKKCDCYIKYSDKDHSNSNNNNVEKPKKSVRFDEKVYETVFFAARLYDRRNFVKYHSSTRHHPPMNNNSKQNNKSKKNRSGSVSSDQGDDDKHVCRQTKSQRAKQSKKDKKKRRLSKKEESNSDDQGYCSSIHSFSD